MAVTAARQLPYEPIRLRDSFVLWTQPVILASGHPLRRNGCLLCGLMIGGRTARFITVIVADHAGCMCGQVPTITQLACAEHQLPANKRVIAAALRLATIAHPEGDHTCSG